MLGAFVALDLFLFYVFWEVMLVPMYLLIGVWGGERRIYAAIKMVLYTMAGSLLMLVAILYLVSLHSAQIRPAELRPADSSTTSPFRCATQRWLFAAFALAFAIKVPMFPVHTWLPDAHTEAPTGGSVILAGVLLKMGTYGFLRFAIPLFPLGGDVRRCRSSRRRPPIGIVYGALVCMVQPDLKKPGGVLVGQPPGLRDARPGGAQHAGRRRAASTDVNHGLSTGALFLAVGVIYERRHTRLISEFGGLWQQLPVYAVDLHDRHAVVGRAARSERLRRRVPHPARRLQVHPRCRRSSAPAGVLLGAVYMLWMYQRVMFGPLDQSEEPAAHRSVDAGDPGVRAHPGDALRHGHLSAAVPQPHGAVGASLRRRMQRRSTASDRTPPRVARLDSVGLRLTPRCRAPRRMCTDELRHCPNLLAGDSAAADRHGHCLPGDGR